MKSLPHRIAFFAALNIVFCVDFAVAQSPTSLSLKDIDHKIAVLQNDYEYKCGDNAKLALCQQIVDSSARTISLLQSLKSTDMSVQARIVKLQILQKTANDKKKQ